MRIKAKGERERARKLLGDGMAGMAKEDPENIAAHTGFVEQQRVDLARLFPE